MAVHVLVCQRVVSVQIIILAYDATPYGLARRDPTTQTTPAARSACSSVTLSNLDYSQSMTITALENRGEYKFPLTELIMQWTLLDELIRNLSLDC